VGCPGLGLLARPVDRILGGAEGAAGRCPGGGGAAGLPGLGIAAGLLDSPGFPLAGGMGMVGEGICRVASAEEGLVMG
jgi:hypothetical protein